MSRTFKTDVEAETFIRDAIRFARDDWNTKVRTGDAMKLAEATVNLNRVLRDEAFMSTEDAEAVRQDLKELEREFVDGFPLSKARAKALLSDLRTYYRNLDENGLSTCVITRTIHCHLSHNSLVIINRQRNALRSF